MPTVKEIEQSYQTHTQPATSGYNGPTTYRGQKINLKHSIRRVARTLISYLDQSQFCQLQIIGLPGSGKSTLAQNIITDLVELSQNENRENYNVHWAGAEDLRNLGMFMDNLSKGQNHVVVFDDISRALEKLKGQEQAEIFEILTTTRHITGEKLCFISLFHYSFAQLKSLRSQAVITIYTSASLVEKTVIGQQLGNDYNARQKLRTFVKIYQDAFSKKKFTLSLSPNTIKDYESGNPFRPCLVINLARVHIALFMKLENCYGPHENNQKRISPEALVENVKKAYGKNGLLALKMLCLSKGHPEVFRNEFVSAWKFTLERISKTYKTDYAALTKILQPDQKRLYRKKDIEDQILKNITELE